MKKFFLAALTVLLLVKPVRGDNGENAAMLHAAGSILNLFGHKQQMDDAAAAAAQRAGNNDDSDNGASEYISSGDAKIRRNDYDGAIADYTIAIGLDPSNAYAYAGRGGAKLNKNDYDGAIADCKKALELKPDYSEAKTNLELALKAKAKN